ncbi:MAG: hypothetical protein Q9226_000821 [Calogaya cf. arnoldii]
MDDELTPPGSQFLAQRQTIESIAAGDVAVQILKLGLGTPSQTTRFTLELIKNADDAKYNRIQNPDVPFIVSETHENNLIHVRSNHDEFSAENVELLCNIVGSAKSAAPPIGGKGIGFKSVFRLCESVHIGSAKHKPLPMVFNRRQALPTCYDGSEINVLRRLGVKHLDMHFFMESLEELGDQGWPNITWHEDLAKVLLSFNIDHLEDIPLVPINSDEGIYWAKPKDMKSKPVYFEGNLEDHRIRSRQVTACARRGISKWEPLFALREAPRTGA